MINLCFGQGNRRFLSNTFIILQWTAVVAVCIPHHFDDDDCNNHRKTVQLPDCMNITSERHRTIITTGNSYSYGFNYGILGAAFSERTSHVNETGMICVPLSPQLLHCNLSNFTKDDVKIENYTLFHGSNLIAILGDYYVDGSGRAYTCNPPVRVNRTTPRCHYISLNSDQYTIFSNGSFYIKPAQTTVSRPWFTVDEQSTQANLCYPLSIEFLNCDLQDKRIVAPYDYSLQNNLKLYFLSDNLFFELGNYYFENDQRDAVLCLKHTTVFKILRMLMIVCCICLALSFIHHWMDSRDTCYKKCLACHNFSLIVACSWYTYTRYHLELQWSISNMQKYVFFTIGYFSYQATASWLAVCGYDIWRSFASLDKFQRRPQSTRRFIYYSIVGWGIPCALLTIVLIINSSGTLQKYLLTTLDIGSSGYFHDNWSLFTFLFFPMQIMYFLNGTFFICAVHRIRRAKGEIHMANNNQQKHQMLRVSLKLSLIMGIFWNIEALFWVIRRFTTFPIRYISDAIIGLHGIVFFSLTTLKKETPGVIRKKLNMIQGKLKITTDRIKQFFCE